MFYKTKHIYHRLLVLHKYEHDIHDCNTVVLQQLPKYHKALFIRNQTHFLCYNSDCYVNFFILLTINWMRQTRVEKKIWRSLQVDVPKILVL